MISKRTQTKLLSVQLLIIQFFLWCKWFLIRNWGVQVWQCPFANASSSSKKKSSISNTLNDKIIFKLIYFHYYILFIYLFIYFYSSTRLLCLLWHVFFSSYTTRCYRRGALFITTLIQSNYDLIPLIMPLFRIQFLVPVQ